MSVDRDGAEPRRWPICLEVVWTRQTGGVSLLWSLPGREGVMERVWPPLEGTRLTDTQWEDLRAHVLDQLDNWYLSVIGTQLELWERPQS